MYIKKVRELLELNQEELAKNLGISRFTLITWENTGVPVIRVHKTLTSLHLLLDHQQYDLHTHERLFVPMELSYDF